MATVIFFISWILSCCWSPTGHFYNWYSFCVDIFNVSGNERGLLIGKPWFRFQLNHVKFKMVTQEQIDLKKIHLACAQRCYHWDINSIIVKWHQITNTSCDWGWLSILCYCVCSDLFHFDSGKSAQQRATFC